VIVRVSIQSCGEHGIVSGSRDVGGCLCRASEIQALEARQFSVAEVRLGEAVTHGLRTGGLYNGRAARAARLRLALGRRAREDELERARERLRDRPTVTESTV